MTRLGRLYLALFIANGAAVVLLWWYGLASSAPAGLAGALNAAGRLTALLGTYLLLAQLVLRTHVTWLVAAFAKDALRSAHTWNAYAAFGLIAAHVLTQIVGYGMQDRVDPLTELGLLVAHYEGMVAAVAGFLLLTGLTIISLERLRHRIAWPTWRALHLYMYAAVLLAVPHEIATGSDFVDAPLAVAYWTALEAVVLGILLAARVPSVWRSIVAAGRPHGATAGVAALVVAAYLLGMVKLAPAPPSRERAAAATTRGVARASAPASVAAAPTATPPAGMAGATMTVEGEAIETPYGSARVRVVLSGGRITDVEPLAMPSATKRSKTISNAVEPWLRKRAISAQGAQFDVLSGATYTSRAYMASLETAMRAAGVEQP
ncbi:MAG TPA: ferric reductase-like transmembrane domain-containing protein [Candidatus Limnocylindria bacterium]|nr:ferric reductase-like transmembrane domain-containing protein [Candidatus Limnocylindria bacterium]